MALARWQATITDEDGNVVPQAFIRVRAETAGMPLATLYSDRFGQVSIANPFQADSEGFAYFHTTGNAYQIEAYKDAFSRTWRYVGVGLASETDLNPFDPQGVWVDDFSYGVGDMVYHEGYVFVSLVDDNLNNEPPITGSPLEPTTDAFWMFIPALQGVPGAGDLYDFSVYVQDRPRDEEVVARHVFTSQIAFDENLTVSRAVAAVAATAEKVFSLKKTGVEFGTVTFAAAATTGTFASDATTFSGGEVLSIVAPEERDSTLADVTITLRGDRVS